MATSDSFTKETFNVAGLLVHVWSDGGVQALSTKEVAAMILIHGRKESTADPAFERTARAVFEWARQPEQRRHAQRDIVVIMFDLRNHGHRVVDPHMNELWSKNPEHHNPTHAIDLYGTMIGTARDVSFVIDFLPSYLFPNGEHTIAEWAAAGTSLGAHIVWFVLKEEPRVRTGIAVMGSPDNIAMMHAVGAVARVPIAPPHVPDALLALMRRLEPGAADHRARSAANPYFGKRVLVVVAEQDVFVPWGMYGAFVEALEVGPGGRKEVVREPGKHVYTDEMMCAVVRFFWEECVVVKGPGKAAL
ncbi:hypothetical protein DENSPDRAFT_926577 [Dentipellis sp. KUC8613]|nr:hypothetical protein DENSPDRAFT_926577 [Dentipellis sp. KUC8613]